MHQQVYKKAVTTLNWPPSTQVISYSRRSVHQPLNHMMKHQIQKQMPVQKII